MPRARHLRDFGLNKAGAACVQRFPQYALQVVWSVDPREWDIESFGKLVEPGIEQVDAVGLILAELLALHGPHIAEVMVVEYHRNYPEIIFPGRG